MERSHARFPDLDAPGTGGVFCLDHEIRRHRGGGVPDRFQLRLGCLDLFLAGRIFSEPEAQASDGSWIIKKVRKETLSDFGCAPSMGVG